MSHIQEEVQKSQQVQLNSLINEYEENGGTWLAFKAENALLPVLRIELSKVLLEYTAISRKVVGKSARVNPER